MFRHLQKCKITVAPIYTMGSADPRSFSRGKRGLAGTLVFIMFDRAVMINALQEYMFLSDMDDIMPQAGVKAGANSQDESTLTATLSTAQGPPPLPESTTGLVGNVQVAEQNLSSVSSDQVPKNPWFADQILPFDVTLAAANEYGSVAVMRIFGLEILNEGYGVSIDDIVSEMQHTYAARTMLGWTPLKSRYAELKAKTP